MFTICRNRQFRCLVSGVVSLYLCLNTFVYATEIFPRVFCHGDAEPGQINLYESASHLTDRSSSLSPSMISGAVFQPATTCSHEDFCPECKAGFGHHLTAIFPQQPGTLPDTSAPEIETTLLLISEYRDSLVPPPPK